MIKKKSIGLILLSLYLVIGGIMSIVIMDEIMTVRVISVVLGIASIVCGVGIFILKRWSRKATIILLLLCIVNSFLLGSPLFQKQRIQQLESYYDEINKGSSSKYLLNDKEVSKAEFLENGKNRIETMKKNNFDFMRIVPSTLFYGLLLLYLFKGTVKQQFEN